MSDAALLSSFSTFYSCWTAPKSEPGVSYVHEFCLRNVQKQVGLHFVSRRIGRFFRVAKSRPYAVSEDCGMEFTDDCPQNYSRRLPPSAELMSNQPSVSSRASLKNTFSDTWVLDTLRAANLKPNVRITQDVKFINSRKKELLGQAFQLKKTSKKVTARELKFILEELQEEDYGLTSFLVKIFCKMDLAYLSELTEAHVKQPRRRPLGADYEQLSLFIEVFKEWETAYKQGDEERSFSIVFYLAMFYLKLKDQSFYWLVYQLFYLALALVDRVPRNEYCEAALRFIFGRFLLEKTILLDEAEEHLTVAARLAKGRDIWSVTCVTGIEDDYIYGKSVYLLHILLIIESDNASQAGDSNKAVTLMEQSVSLVDLVGSDEAISQAWLDLAVFYFQADLPKAAIIYALKALKFFTSVGQVENMGLAMLYLGIFYKKEGYYEKAFGILKELIELAEDPKIICLQTEAADQLDAIEEISLNSYCQRKEIKYGDTSCEPKLTEIRTNLRVYRKKVEEKQEEKELSIITEEDEEEADTSEDHILENSDAQ